MLTRFSIDLVCDLFYPTPKLGLDLMENCDLQIFHEKWMLNVASRLECYKSNADVEQRTKGDQKNLTLSTSCHGKQKKCESAVKTDNE